MKLEQFNCELTYTNPVYHGNGTICGCCGSNVVTSNPDDRLLRDFNVSALRNDGISIWPSKTAVTEETDEYWCESIPVGNEFLVVKHRKVTCPEDDYYNEDENNE